MEQLATYLRRVADDQRDSGRYATADDYEQAAAAIDRLTAALRTLADMPTLLRYEDFEIRREVAEIASTALAKVQA